MTTDSTDPGPDRDRDPDDRASEPAGLARARLVARVLDDAVRVPGTDRRVGLDPVLSVLPVAGDALGALLSLYVVVEAARAGVGGRALLRMLALVALDAAVGSVPVVGPAFDAVVRANERNVALFERAVSPPR